MKTRQDEPQLPADVIAAIEAGRKIEAIRLLREAEGIELAEAKRLVDLYAAKNPNLLAGSELKDEGSGGTLLFAIAVVVAAYLAWRFLG